MQIPADGDAAVKFGCKFQLAATPRWNLDANSSWRRRRGEIWMQIPAGGEAEVEFASKFHLRATLRWNLDANFSKRRS